MVEQSPKILASERKTKTKNKQKNNNNNTVNSCVPASFHSMEVMLRVAPSMSAKA